jgi:hypothetical protein
MDTYTYIICHMYIYIYVIIYIYVYIPWCCKQFVIPTSPSTFWDPIIWSWISESRHIRTMVFRALGYALYSIIHSLNIRISKYTNWYFRLPPGRVSWPARPFQHTESNSFQHTGTTFEFTNWYFILPLGPRGLALHIFKCRYRACYKCKSWG